MTDPTSVRQVAANQATNFGSFYCFNCRAALVMAGPNLSLRGAKSRVSRESNPGFVPAAHENRDCFAALVMTCLGS
ncbi:MAG: hypothetical protein ACLQPD_32445 [Desulfomonilaceae bacterium]